MAMPEFYFHQVPVSDGTVINKEVVEDNNGVVPAIVTEDEIVKTKVDKLDDTEKSEHLKQVKEDKLGDLKDIEDANFINELPEKPVVIEDEEVKHTPKKRKTTV